MPGHVQSEEGVSLFVRQGGAVGGYDNCICVVSGRMYVCGCECGCLVFVYGGVRGQEGRGHDIICYL